MTLPKLSHTQGQIRQHHIIWRFSSRISNFTQNINRNITLLEQADIYIQSLNFKIFTLCIMKAVWLDILGKITDSQYDKCQTRAAFPALSCMQTCSLNWLPNKQDIITNIEQCNTSNDSPPPQDHNWALTFTSGRFYWAWWNLSMGCRCILYGHFHVEIHLILISFKACIT
jgi:hypothetical protein